VSAHHSVLPYLSAERHGHNVQLSLGLAGVNARDRFTDGTHAACNVVARMDLSSQTLLALELETHAYHRDADEAWLDLLQPLVTRGQYADQLARAYAFEAPLEAALAHTPHIPSLIGPRARSRMLAQDLFELDYPLAKLTPRLIAPFPSVAEALGWLYALERRARLFGLVRHNIRARLPSPPTEYLADDRAPRRWEKLGHVLDSVARSTEVTDQIIHAAHDAFRCQLDWYVGEQPLRRGA
jgi:heme oxygenase